MADYYLMLNFLHYLIAVRPISQMAGYYLMLNFLHYLIAVRPILQMLTII